MLVKQLFQADQNRPCNNVLAKNSFGLTKLKFKTSWVSTLNIKYIEQY